MTHTQELRAIQRHVGSFGDVSSARHRASSPELKRAHFVLELLKELVAQITPEEAA